MLGEHGRTVRVLALALKLAAHRADSESMDEQRIDEAIAWGDYALALSRAADLPAANRTRVRQHVASCVMEDGEAAHGIELRAALCALGLERWEAKRLAVSVSGSRVVHALTSEGHALPLAQLCDMHQACTDRPGAIAPTSGLMLAPRGAWADAPALALQRCRACEQLLAADDELEAELAERVYWPLVASSYEQPLREQLSQRAGEIADGADPLALWDEVSQQVLTEALQYGGDEAFAKIFPAAAAQPGLSERLGAEWYAALVQFVWAEMMHPHWWYEHMCLFDEGRLRIVEVRHVQRLCWHEAASRSNVRADGLVVGSLDPPSKLLDGLLRPLAQRKV